MLTIHVGRANIVVKRFGLSKTQWMATIGGLVNLGIEIPAVLTVLAADGIHITNGEKAIIHVVSWLSAYVARSILKSKSGIPGEDPNVPAIGGEGADNV